MVCVCVCVCVVRRRAVLRDADGQLRGHLSDWMVEDRRRRKPRGSFGGWWWWGVGVASPRIFMGSYKGIVCICVCLPDCVSAALCKQPPPPPLPSLKVLTELLDVTLPPWLW